MKNLYYPTFLGTRHIFSSQQRGKGSPEKVLFSGEDFILRVSVNQNLLDTFKRKYEVSNLTIQDQNLLFHIVDYVQKTYGHDFNKEEKVKKSMQDFYKRRYETLINEENLKSSEANDLIKREMEIDFRLGRNDYFNVEIKVSELLNELEIGNTTSNRNSIVESFIYLYSLDLSFFEIKAKAAEEFRSIKSGKNYSEYIEDLNTWFKEKAGNLDYFNIHLRKFIENLSILKKENGEIFVVFSINKIFLEVLAGKKISYQRFNVSPLSQIKGNAAKLLYVQLTLAPKKYLSEDYLFDLLDLKKSRRKADKVRTIRSAFEELKAVGFSYKYSQGQFQIFNKNLEK